MKTWKKFPRVVLYLAVLTSLLVGMFAPAREDQSAKAAPLNAPQLACPATTIAEWTFLGDTTAPSIGSGGYANGTGVTLSFATGNPDRAISFTGWTTSTTTPDPNDYVEFSVDTTSYSDINLGFDYRSTTAGPQYLDLRYSTDGSFFSSYTVVTLTRNSNFNPLSFNLSTIPAINNNPNTKFRLYGYGSGGGTLGIDNVIVSDICTPPPPGTGNISIVNKVNGQDVEVEAGVCSNVVFSLAATNDGAAVTNIQARFLLPAGLRYVSDNSGTPTSGISYTSSSGIWLVGDMAAGETKTILITARLEAGGPTINTTAVVLNSTSATNTDGSSVKPKADSTVDLAIGQKWRRLDVAARAEIILTATNLANYAATSVQVRDVLPSGLDYISAVPAGVYNSNTGIWNVGRLEASPNPLSPTSAMLTLTVKADKDGDGTTNTASIYRSDQCDLITSNNEAIAEVMVSDLQLTQTADIDSARRNAVFTITVANGNTDNASGVKVRSLFTGYGVLSDNSAGTFDRLSGIWNVGALPKNSSKTLVVTTQPTSPGVFPENWAQVSDANEVDPDSVPGNCSDSITTCVEDDDAGAPSADLSLTQDIVGGVSFIDRGSRVTFRLRVANDGYADATNVEVKDLLPSGLSYSSHSPSAESYNRTTGIWKVGNLAKDASKTLDITATLSSYGIKTTIAEVWKSGQSDPDSSPGDGSITDDDDDSEVVTSYRAVLINEVAWLGTAASNEDEWMELYNPSNAEITLTGWKIRFNGCGAAGTDYIALNSGLKIAAGGYFLLERGSTATDNTTVSDIAANQIYLVSVSPKLKDSGEILYLCDPNGNPIDTANKNGGGWPKGGGKNYASMERQGNTAEIDDAWVTNTGVVRNGRDANGDPIYGTPGKVNSTGIQPTATPVTTLPTPIPIVRPVINEFLARPGFDWNQDGRVDVFDEFVEIKNIGAVDVNLNGWKLDDEDIGGSPFFTLPNITLKPGGRAVFYGLQTKILLGDGGDTVRLLNPGNKIYDAYTYTLVMEEDVSVCRLPDGNGVWYEDCVPTPNLTNSREGQVPSMPAGEGAESPVCNLPDTLPADFFFAECRGYGADIWRSFFWDQFGWQGDRLVRQNMSKWESFVE